MYKYESQKCTANTRIWPVLPDADSSYFWGPLTWSFLNRGRLLVESLNDLCTEWHAWISNCAYDVWCTSCTKCISQLNEKFETLNLFVVSGIYLSMNIYVWYECLVIFILLWTILGGPSAGGRMVLKQYLGIYEFRRCLQYFAQLLIIAIV